MALTTIAVNRKLVGLPIYLRLFFVVRRLLCVAQPLPADYKPEPNTILLGGLFPFRGALGGVGRTREVSAAHAVL